MLSNQNFRILEGKSILNFINRNNLYQSQLLTSAYISLIENEAGNKSIIYILSDLKALFYVLHKCAWR